MNISFPSATQGTSSVVDASSLAPLQAFKDRTAITVRWAAHDDNGDDLTYSLYLRGDGEHDWRLLKDDITEKAYTFDSALVPDGGYEVKVVASDAPSHSPGDALTGSKESERFEVDTTPPVVSVLKAAEEPAAQASAPGPVHVTFDAEDAASPVAHAEYSVDAGDGNISSRWAAFRIRSANTTTFTFRPRLSTRRPASISSPFASMTGTKTSASRRRWLARRKCSSAEKVKSRRDAI